MTPKKDLTQIIRETICEHDQTAPGRSATDVAAFVAEAGGVATMDDIISQRFPDDAVLKALQNGKSRGGDGREAPLLKAISFGEGDDAPIVVYLTNKGWTQAGYSNKREAKPSAGRIQHQLAPGRFAERVRGMQEYWEQDGWGPLTADTPLCAWVGNYSTFEVLTGADCKAEIDSWPSRMWPLIQTPSDNEWLTQVRGRYDLQDITKTMAGRFLKEGAPPIRPDAFLKIAHAPTNRWLNGDWGDEKQYADFGGRRHCWDTIVTNVWRRMFNCMWTSSGTGGATQGREATGWITNDSGKAIAVNYIERLPMWVSQTSILTVALEFEFNAKSRAALMQKIETHAAAITCGLTDATLWLVNDQRVARDLERAIRAICNETGLPSDRMRIMSWREVDETAPVIDIDPYWRASLFRDFDSDSLERPLRDMTVLGSLQVDLKIAACPRGKEVWNSQEPRSGYEHMLSNE